MCVLYRYDASAYATLFHLAGMRACVELATAMKDQEYMDLCSLSLDNVTAAFNRMQWAGDHYAAGSSGCVRDTGCSEQIGVFSDTLYAQVTYYNPNNSNNLNNPYTYNNLDDAGVGLYIGPRFSGGCEESPSSSGRGGGPELVCIYITAIYIYIYTCLSSHVQYSLFWSLSEHPALET